MGVYKSRLKLVVPHKYQQQIQQEQHSSNEPGEEILRDTYEFFPELLLCIEYRESLGKQHNNNFISVNLLARKQSRRLRCFHSVISVKWKVWRLTLRMTAMICFIASVTSFLTSILKILELYAHHLQALWSVRLMNEPDQLRCIQLTEFNAYYSDRSQRSLNTTARSQSRIPGVSENRGDGPICDSRTVVQHVATEALEHRLAEEYWNRKVTALSNRNPGDDEMEVGSDSKLQLLSDEVICSWDQHTLVSYLLRWSDEYAIRTEVNALSVVTNHMMKHEVQKFRFMGRDDTNVTSGSYVNRTMVDSSTRQLLAAVGRAQMLIQDAVIGSEKLALHSVSNQLPNEKKQLKPLDFKGRTGNKTSSSSREAAPSCPNSTCINDAGAHSDDAVSETVFHAEAIASKDADSYDAIEDVNIDIDMQELCGHKSRSARMREKVQMQSLQLARQTVDIFRNIRNMYGSQRR
ncbi:unnamed protein product [Peronospora farinosa]|uniref:Uncharacterized protein n=1 Tax=Peronospora farinosa TaxID=134698 RepID=A0AAV0SQQ0_9STRA|nr:unnamed protein product [Peronospora farinosa]